jgi:hypothetical protein
MAGDDGNRTPKALAFWDERGSAADRAWDKWRRDLDALIALLDAHRAESAADEERLVKMKAEASATHAAAEAEVARLEVEAALAHAAFERSLYGLRGGRMQ